MGSLGNAMEVMSIHGIAIGFHGTDCMACCENLMELP